MKRGIRVKTSSYTRHHVNITMTQAKAVSNYTNSILANMEATDEGYDEALLLDSSGFVSEGAGENIFVVKNGVIYTPDLSAGALNGITRNTIFHIARTWAWRSCKSASRATRCTSPTKPSSLAPPPKSPHPRAGSHRGWAGATTWAAVAPSPKNPNCVL